MSGAFLGTMHRPWWLESPAKPGLEGSLEATIPLSAWYEIGFVFMTALDPRAYFLARAAATADWISAPRNPAATIFPCGSISMISGNAPLKP